MDLYKIAYSDLYHYYTRKESLTTFNFQKIKCTTKYAYSCTYFLFQIYNKICLLTYISLFQMYNNQALNTVPLWTTEVNWTRNKNNNKLSQQEDTWRLKKQDWSHFENSWFNLILSFFTLRIFHILPLIIFKLFICNM